MAIRRLGAKIDPRVIQSRASILRAALDELGDAGFGAFTIESVAARAGVGKSTIYRHWHGKLGLVDDAFRTLHQEMAPELETGGPRERLERILRHVAKIAAEPPFSACLPALIDGAERDPNLRRFHYHFQAQAREPLIKLIAEGVNRGEFPTRVEPELATFALLGAIFFRRLMTSTPLEQARVSELIDTVLGLCGACPAPARHPSKADKPNPR